MKIKVAYLAAGLLCLGTIGCEITTSDYDVKKVTAVRSDIVPLGFGSLSVYDAVKNIDGTKIQIYPESDVLYMQYSDTIDSPTAAELLPLADRGFSFNILMLPASKLPTSEPIEYPPFEPPQPDFNFLDKSLEELKFKNTRLQVDISFLPSSPVVESLFDVVVKMPGCVKDGASFEGRVAIGNSAEFSLNDYVFTLSGNKFDIQVVVIEKAHGNTVNVPVGNINVDLGFKNVAFRHLKGNIGTATSNSENRIVEMGDVGQVFNDADVSFKDVKIEFTMINSFGVPIDMIFETVKVSNEDDESVTLNLTPASPVVLNAPTEMGTTATTMASVNDASDALDINPDKLEFSVNASVDGTSGGFCTDSSFVRSLLNVEVPFYGRVSSIILRDTMSIDLDEIKSSEFESVALVVNAENEMPIGLQLQVYLADKDYTILDSLFTPTDNLIIKSGKTNSDGDVVSAGLVDDEFVIDKAKLDKLFIAKKILLVAQLASGQEGDEQIHVKFKSKDKLDINLSVKTKVKVEYEEGN